MEESLKLKKATYHLWTFTISKLIASFGAQVYSFAISFYILHLTGSATSFATNLICNILPRTIAAPFVGALTDRYSRKMITISAQIVTTIAIMGLLTYTLTAGLSLAAIYTTSCILSLTSMCSSVAFTSSITGLVDKNRIQKAMSLNQMSVSFASIASPAIGGLLYGSVSMPVFLIAYISASCLALLLESTMNFKLFANQKKVEQEKRKETMWQSMMAGVSYLKLQKLVTTLIWLALLINFLFGAFEIGYSYILVEKLKVSSQHFGITQGSFAVGMLLLSLYFSIRKEIKYPFLLSSRAIFGLSVILASVALPIFINVPNVFAYYMGVMFSLGALIITVNTPIQVMMQKQIADEFKGRVFSIVETMAMALMPLGMVLYGFLYDRFPAQWILLSSAALLAGVVLYLTRPSVIREVHPELNKMSVKDARGEAVS